MNTDSIQQKLHQLSSETDSFNKATENAEKEQEVLQAKISEAKQRYSALTADLRLAREANAKFEHDFSSKTNEKNRLVSTIKSENHAAKQLAAQLKAAENQDTKDKKSHSSWMKKTTATLNDLLEEQYVLRLQSLCTPESLQALVDVLSVKSPGEDEDLATEIVKKFPKLRDAFKTLQETHFVQAGVTEKLNAARTNAGFSQGEQKQLEEDWVKHISPQTTNVETSLFYKE